MKSINKLLQLLLWATACLPFTPAQGQPFSQEILSPNEETDGRFGRSVAGVGGDVNGDGVPDVIVGAYQEDPDNSLAAAGRAYIMSGADGSLIHPLITPNPDFAGWFGFSVAGVGGDVNADSVPDVLVGAPLEVIGPDMGTAYLMSGADGSVIHTLLAPASPAGGINNEFGTSVAGIGGDVNGDGVPDVIVGSRHHPTDSVGIPNAAGRAYIMSGADGSILHTLFSPNSEDAGFFGYASVAGTGGDLNGDGVPDVIVGAYLEDPDANLTDAGRAYVMSGADGSLIHTLTSPNPVQNGRFGSAVAAIGGDINEDGIPDLMVSAIHETLAGSPNRAGLTYLMSGADGSVLHTLSSPNERIDGRFGGSVAGLGDDLDADGVMDVIVGAWREWGDDGTNNSGRVYVISGADGSVLQSLVSPNPQFDGQFGISVGALGGDAHGDGLPDIVVGAHNEDHNNSPFLAGRAYVMGSENTATSIAQPQASPGTWLRVAPNPFSQQTTLSLSDFSGTPVAYQILTLTGRRVAAGTLSEPATTIGRDLPPGLYFATFRRADGQQETVKLVKAE